MRFVDELEFAVGWIAAEPRFMQRTSHAIAAGGRVWVIGTAPYYCAGDECVAVSPLLRLTPPRSLLLVQPEHVLVGHGAGLHERATAAVLEAVTTSRRRIPAWLWSAARSLGKPSK